MKNLIYLAVLAAIAVQKYQTFLLPHGPAVEIPPVYRPKASPVDSSKSLQLSSGKSIKIIERLEPNQEALLIGPETIIFDKDGVMYTLTKYAKLVNITDVKPHDDASKIGYFTAKVEEVADLGMGRPLGGKFDDKSGCLYFADPIIGLARICLFETTNGGAMDKRSTQSTNNLKLKLNPTVEFLASRTKLSDGSFSAIVYADDVDIGPKTGHIYFSDATNIRPDRDSTGQWDLLYPSVLEFLRGTKSGRLLRYKPETGEVDILATGAAFGNGVAVDKNEKFVIFTSTFEGAVYKYHLEWGGLKSGTAEKILDDFPGVLDGCDCSFARGTCFVAIPTAITPAAKIILGLPPTFGIYVRSLMMVLPRWFVPGPLPYGGVAEFSVGDGKNTAKITQIIQDREGRDFTMITGVTEHGGKLYLGNLHNKYIGVLDLD